MVCLFDTISQNFIESNTKTAISNTSKTIQYTFGQISKEIGTFPFFVDEKVLCIVENNIRDVIIMLGIFYQKACWIPFDLNNVCQLAETVRQVGPTKIVYSKNCEKLVDEVVEKLQFDYYKCGYKNSSLGVDLNMITISNSHADSIKRFEAHIEYVMMTSGTTSNTRKLVHVPSECIIPNIDDLYSRLDKESKPLRMILTAPLTFDPSIIEVFLCLKSNGTLFVCDSDEEKNKLFSHHAKLLNISLLMLTPSFWGFLNHDAILDIRGLKIVFGGEQFPLGSIIKFKERIREREIELFNIYGTTEISCWASISQLDIQSPLSSIGMPLTETYFNFFCNGQLNDSLTENEIGELIICSDKRFSIINDEVCSKDFQIKRLGKRVQLEVVENEACRILGVKKACFPMIPDIIIEIPPDDFTKYLNTLTRKLENGEFRLTISQDPEFFFIHHGCHLLGVNYGFMQENLTSYWAQLGGSSISAMAFSIILFEFNSKVQQQDYLNRLLNYPINTCLELLIGGSCKKKHNSIDLRVPTTTYVEKNLTLSRVYEKGSMSHFKETKNELTAFAIDMRSCVDSSPLMVDFKEVGSGFLNQYIYCGSHAGYFMCYEIVSNTMIWSTLLPSRIEANASFDSKSLLVAVGCHDRNVYFFDALNGRKEFFIPTDDIVKSTVLFVDDLCYFGSHDGKFYTVSIPHQIVVNILSVEEAISCKALELPG
ncbi:acetyl-CoA synthetase-like protein [Rozella allomycis CSF55]|uniref:Acetyl-CoA synthetase-like protein n=1 Tax=Rozella allomycis (strain CSF55) TaxID=988480 RepID=A0A075AUI8_ROZAC|nr:Acyl-CoA synthetase family member 4 domain-containing protein [Rozella allomycis CSF55]RKP16735.1 acetyl-CoA synthetase-like protein [Rozella allomycis CSF55]|eukprot:EPZ32172.1 Acyl-CoA synthetase family member 4 domain-containing protein [Rozella allomycis CSF55]